MYRSSVIKTTGLFSVKDCAQTDEADQGAMVRWLQCLGRLRAACPAAVPVFGAPVGRSESRPTRCNLTAGLAHDLHL